MMGLLRSLSILKKNSHIYSLDSYPFLGDDIMNCIIPFEKKEKFNYPVSEICSISLEHEITKNEDELLGNFFVSGTCKEHELSVNTPDFNFVIPFSVEYTNKINTDTLEFTIDNFTYDLNNNELDIKIDYALNAEDLDEERDIFEINPYDLIEDNPLSSEVKTEDETFNIDLDNDKKELLSVDNETINDSISDNLNENYKSLITNMSIDEDYATYILYFVKNDDTIESICQKYNTSKDIVLKLNNITSIDGVNKLLIPLKDE